MVNRTNHPERDLSGQVFGRLTVRKKFTRIYSTEHKHSESLWLCDCSCGKEHIVRMKNLVSGGTRSCGCLAASVKRMRRVDKKGKRFEANR